MQLSFDFSLPARVNLTNALMQLHKDLYFHVCRLYDDVSSKSFSDIRFNAMMMRNHLLCEQIITTSQWEALKEHYDYCIDLYEERLYFLKESF